MAHDSRQLHRPRFDRELAAHAQASGAEHLVGRAKGYERVEGPLRHRLEVSTSEGPAVVRARWIVDASGRERFLGKKLTEYRRPDEHQRCVFWFRLVSGL